MTSRQKIKTALVLSGGGLPGLEIHAGYLLAIDASEKYEIELVSGTSAGAIIGSMYSGGMSSEEIAAAVRGLRDEDIRDRRFLWYLRAGNIDSIHSNKKVKKLIDRYIRRNFLDCRIETLVTATNLQTGQSEELSKTDALRESVLASSSILGMFPPVRIEGCDYYSDGGTGANIPISEQLVSRFDKTIVLIATGAREKWNPNGGLIGNLAHNINLMSHDQVNDIRLRWADDPRVIFVYYSVDTPKTMRFSKNHELIKYAAEYAKVIV